MSVNINHQTNKIGVTTSSEIELDSSGLIKFETGGSERLRVDENGQVGIGATSLTRELTVKKNNQCDVSIVAATNQSAQLLFGDTDSDNRGIIQYDNASDFMAFTVAGSERARLTDGGDLRVGKTSSALADVGHELDAEGYAYHTRDGNTPLYINRKTSDGNLIQLYKDSSNIGHIGTVSGDIFIAGPDSNHAALRLAANSRAVLPVTSGGSLSDDNTNLGQATARFNDLYLSGGVYLGGTGSSNLLDDYEEGTFTATCDSGVLLYSANNLCSYVKIGNLVTVTGQVRVNSDNGGQAFVINNLPFANASLSEEAELSVGAYRISDVNVAGSGVGTNCRVSASKIFFEQNIDNGASQSINAGNNGYYGFTVTYRTA